MRYGGDASGAFGGFPGGSSVDLASPGAIGGTTPAAGTFTTLTATTAVVVPLGSSSAPSIQPAGGGGNDGIYFVNATNIGYVMDGAERHRMGSGGLHQNLSGYSSGASIGTPDASLIRAAANSWVFGGGAAAFAGAATSRTELNKAVTGIADATPTAAITFTVPNAAHGATYLVHALVTMGAGGAVGANEAGNALLGIVTIARTAGLATVATYKEIDTTGSTAVAGADSMAIAAALSSVSGANNATQTFTLNLTATKGGGSGASHDALLHLTLLNQRASGITAL